MRSPDERGFTLVELLIAIVISGLLSTALGGAIIIGLKSTNSSSVQLAQSRDIQLVQGALPRDVFTATGVQTNVAAGSGTCSGQQTLLDLTWSTPSLSSGNGPPTTTLQAYEVDYIYSVNALNPPAAQTGSLTRKLYTGTAPSCTIVSSTVVASSLSKTSALQTAAISGSTVTLTLTDSSCTKSAVGAQLRSATTSTTVATTTTTAPACTG